MNVDDLPRVNVKPEFRDGRNPHDGYQRGWGLGFGGLNEKILADPDYQEAYRYAANRGIVTVSRMMNIFLILKFYAPQLSHGDIIEYGSFRGGSAFFMGALAKKFLPGAQVYALDTFTGMPATDAAIDSHKKGEFAVDFAEVGTAKVVYGLENVHLVRGLFEDTGPRVLSGAKRFVLSHIDCDILSAVAYAYDSCRTQMVNNGYIVFDDSTTPSCLGATEAVERLVIQRDGLLSEQTWPHHVFRARELAKG
jgi:hypothetical protein